MKPPILHLVSLLAILTARSEPGSKSPPPAHVSQTVGESDLIRITLTPDAETRLGIITEPVRLTNSPRTRLLGGEVVLPLRPPANAVQGPGPADAPGALLPATTPAELLRLAQAQIDAEALVDQARVQVDLADKALARAQQMLQDKAGAVRAVDEAQAQFDSMSAALKAARAKRELLGPNISDAIHSAHLWIRIPVFVGDIERLDETAEVPVGHISGQAAGPFVMAKPVSGFPSANAGAATVDLFYELTSTHHPFRLGQRVGINLPFREQRETLAVPWSSVVLDVSGGAWVYERIQPHTYVRRRVEIRRVLGADAELSHGPEPGTFIVTEGAAELFGTEFGVGH